MRNKRNKVEPKASQPNSAIPSVVLAANKTIDEDQDDQMPQATTPAEIPQHQPQSTIVTTRKQYTRADFAVASAGAWVSGFACEKCGCQDMRVIDTRRMPGDGMVVRMRRCRNCGHQQKTVEQ